MKGWGLKSSVCTSKPEETKLFGGISQDGHRDIPEVPEKLAKKCLCSMFDPIFTAKYGTQLQCNREQATMTLVNYAFASVRPLDGRKRVF